MWLKGVKRGGAIKCFDSDQNASSGKATAMKRLSAPITAIGLGIVLSTYAVAGSSQASTTQIAQVQNQKENMTRERERKKETLQQRERERQNVRQPAPGVQRGPQQQMRERSQYERRQQERSVPALRQQAPGIRPGMQQQTRERFQYDRRQQERRVPDIRQRYNWQQYRPGQRPPDWRQHRAIDPGLWERNFSATRRFRWQPYHRPDGWYYRRWAFGMVLPTIFWTRNYWITDYWMFDLMNPPYGYVWVRYGDDALLVNVQTGLILRVVYSVFY